MFGIIDACHLCAGERPNFMAHLCGVCLGLRRYHGHAAGLAINTDAALLSILCEAQKPQLSRRIRSVCALRGFRPHMVVDPASDGIRHGAVVSALAGAGRIMDGIADGDAGIRYFPSVFKALARKWNRTARKEAGRLRFDSTPLESLVRMQPDVEQVAGRDFQFYSRPTEIAGALACGHTAVVCGIPENRKPLEEIGRMFGRIIYLVDSYRDRLRDIEHHDFNPLNLMPAHDIHARALDLFREAHDRLRRQFDRLRLEVPDLSSRIFIDRLEAAGLQALDAGKYEEPKTDSRKKRKKKSCCDRLDCCCDACDCCSCFSGCDCPCPCD